MSLVHLYLEYSWVSNEKKAERLKERMDPRTLNGGFVGLNGLVIKSHGSSDSKSFYSALKLAKNMCKTKSA